MALEARKDFAALYVQNLAFDRGNTVLIIAGIRKKDGPDSSYEPLEE